MEARIHLEGPIPLVVAKASPVLRAFRNSSDERRVVKASLSVIFLTSSKECSAASRPGEELKRRLKVRIS